VSVGRDGGDVIVGSGSCVGVDDGDGIPVGSGTGGVVGVALGSCVGSGTGVSVGFGIGVGFGHTGPSARATDVRIIVSARIASVTLTLNRIGYSFIMIVILHHHGQR